MPSHSRASPSAATPISRPISRRIALIGASSDPTRLTARAQLYLRKHGFEGEIYPVHPRESQVLGERAYPTVTDIPGPVDMVEIFRNSEAAGPITDEALALDPLPKVIWMQLSVRNDEAAARAEAKGVTVIMNRCPKMEFGRLSGEIGWVGVNRRVIDNRKPLLFSKGGTMKNRAQP